MQRPYSVLHESHLQNLYLVFKCNEVYAGRQGTDIDGMAVNARVHVRLTVVNDLSVVIRNPDMVAAILAGSKNHFHTIAGGIRLQVEEFLFGIEAYRNDVGIRELPVVIGLFESVVGDAVQRFTVDRLIE